MAHWPFLFLNINFKLLWFFFLFVFFLADRLSPSCLISPHKCLLNTNVLERKCYSRKRSPVVRLHCLELISFLETERFPPQSISVSCLIVSSAGVGVDSLARRGGRRGRGSWSSRWLWTCERICACFVCVCALLRPSQWRHKIGRGLSQTRTADCLLQQSLHSCFFCDSRVVVVVVVVCVLLLEDPTWARASRFFFFFFCCCFFCF